MTQADLQKEINRIKNLKNNKFSESEITLQAKNNLRCREFKNNPLFTVPEEQKSAEEKFRNYLQNNIIESENDIDVLRSLIYNEVYEQRLQKQINEVTSPDPDNPDKKLFFSDKLTSQLTDIQDQKLSLKTKLGIGVEEKNKNELTGLQLLKKRFNQYINQNKNEFTIVAPDGTILLLRRRVKDFDAMEHPFFAGRWLFNYEILKDVKKKIITKEQAWRYLSCASQGGNYKPAFDEKYCTDYIEYCLEKWNEITNYFEK
jgi:hypothetical protein